MTSYIPQGKPCDDFHRAQHELRSPFNNPKFLGGPGNAELTVNIQHCSFRHQDDDALLRFTVTTPEGTATLDLPVDTADDLTRRIRELSVIAQDLDGLDGYHAARYRALPDECEC